MALNSMQKIENFIKECGNQCEYAKRPTFRYADSKSSVKDLEDEYKFRIKNNFSCKLYKKDNNPFPFPILAGIYAENGGCEFNPFFSIRCVFSHI